MSIFNFPAVTEVLGIDIHAWKIVGLTGSAVFGARFFLQWIASERAGRSLIPFGFWECSTLGSLLTLSYFAFYQKDPVGVLMTFMPLPIYLRNVYWMWSGKRPKHPGNAPRPPD
jgi:lipid-A-disaccharide synthase-like uncharacterized protein